MSDAIIPIHAIKGRGTATRMGYTEVLYVTELAGLMLTWMGYRMSIRPVAVAATA